MVHGEIEYIYATQTQSIVGYFDKPVYTIASLFWFFGTSRSKVHLWQSNTCGGCPLINLHFWTPEVLQYFATGPWVHQPDRSSQKKPGCWFLITSEYPPVPWIKKAGTCRFLHAQLMHVKGKIIFEYIYIYICMYVKVQHTYIHIYIYIHIYACICIYI